jgi:bifunctional non-homologous end joining protein LigD
MSGKGESIIAGGRKLTFSNLSKPLYPTGFTKGDVIDYYGRVADAMLPLLKGRAVTLKRYPNGTDAPFFFEKRCPPHKPDWVKTADVVGSTGTVNHCIINNIATLLWAANLAAIEFHVPMALATKPDRPTAMVFDLDPGEPATLIDCLHLGLGLKSLLAELDLDCVAKTSGSKGLHIYVPLNTATTFDKTKTFARAVADRLVKDNPGEVTATMSRALRKGKIFVDWSQNDTHKTTVCAFSLRAKTEPSVSTPLTWAEIQSAVKHGKTDSLIFSPAEVIRRVSRGKNRWIEIQSTRQKLPDPARLARP